MEIVIERKNLGYIIPLEKLYWKECLKSKIGLYLVLVIPAALFFLDTIGTYLKTGSINNITFGIGLSLIFFIVINTCYILLSRYRSIQFTKKTYEQSKKYEEVATITITDWGIKVKAHTYNFEFSWSYIQSYQIKGDFLMLHPAHQRLTNITVDKTQIKNSEYTELITFLNNRFPSSKKNGK